MIQEAISRLEFLCDTVPAKLTAMGDELLSKKETVAWSKKEELGHLIDSATNNHHRLVRARYEDTPNISYDPDQWVSLNGYANLPAKHVIALWELYNRHLVFVLKKITTNDLQKLCRTGDTEHTLEFIATDYVVHLEHHLRHIGVMEA